MAILILEEIDVEGADDEVNASLQKEADIFLESFGARAGKDEA